MPRKRGRPVPSRICGTIDCGRANYARGRCERCYRRYLRKQKAKATAAQETPASYTSVDYSPANTPNKEVKSSVSIPAPTADRGGVDARSSTSVRRFSGEELSRRDSGEVRPAPSASTGSLAPRKGRAALPQTIRGAAWIS